MAAHVQVREPAAWGRGGAILRGGSSDIHQGVVVVGYPGVFWGGGGVPGPSATSRLIPRQTLLWSPASLGARHGEDTEPVKDCFTPAG